jgi:hypothetical protein
MAVSPATPPVTISQVAVVPAVQNPIVQAAVNVGSAQAVGVVARLQNNGDAYVAALTSQGVAEILLYHAASNTFTVLGSKPVPGGLTSATLLFTVNGSTLSLFINGSSSALITVTDTTLVSAGGVGLFAQGGGGIVTSFLAAGF